MIGTFKFANALHSILYPIYCFMTIMFGAEWHPEWSLVPTSFDRSIPVSEWIDIGWYYDYSSGANLLSEIRLQDGVTPLATQAVEFITGNPIILLFTLISLVYIGLRLYRRIIN